MHGEADKESERTDRLLLAAYDDLRALARRYMQEERPDHPLQATALVHEAVLRLAAIKHIDWQGRTHLFAVAARQMRRVLVEYARAEKAEKRGRRSRRITLDDNLAVTWQPSVEILALEEALDRLAEIRARSSQVAELRLYGGMLVPEVAEVLGISERTVKRDWLAARAWLARELDPAGSESS